MRRKYNINTLTKMYLSDYVNGDLKLDKSILNGVIRIVEKARGARVWITKPIVLKLIIHSVKAYRPFSTIIIKDGDKYLHNNTRVPIAWYILASYNFEDVNHMTKIVDDIFDHVLCDYGVRKEDLFSMVSLNDNISDDIKLWLEMQ